MPQNAQNRGNNNEQDRLLTMDPMRCAQLLVSANLLWHTFPYIQVKIDILFVQEPYCYNGEPCYIPPDYLTFHVSSDTNPRAALLNRREIAHGFMLLHHFSNPNNIIVVTSTNPQLRIASSYLPPYNTLEQDLTPIGSFLTSVKPIHLIWGLDANSKLSI